MIIYLHNDKQNNDHGEAIELPDNILRTFGASTEFIEHNGITYYRSINYSIMSPYGWSIMNAEQRSEAS